MATMHEYTRLRPHWRPTHDVNPAGFERWIAPDGAAGWVKILNPDGHHIRRVWEVAPQAMILLRNHGISEQKAEIRRDPVGTVRRHTEFWQRFVEEQRLGDGVDRLVFEGVNEYSWEPVDLPPVIEYTVARVELMHRAGLAPCVLEMNTGWPTNHGVKDAPPDWSPFEPVRRALLDYGGYLGVHEYWDYRGIAADWTWNPGRILQQPETWDRVPVLVTECGADQAVNAPRGTPNVGWQGKLTVDEYMAQLTEYDRRYRMQPRLRARCRALFVFTHDFDHPWDTFDTRPLLERLCLHAEWTRQQPAPAEVTPPVSPVTIHLPSIQNGAIPAEPTAENPAPQPAPVELPAVAAPAVEWLLGALARVLGIEPVVARAVLNIESGGRSFSEGRLVIRFENHIFSQELGDAERYRRSFRHNDAGRPWIEHYWRPSPGEPWRPVHLGSRDFAANQRAEWAAFELARGLDETAALRSLAMGAGQVMGFNHAAVGYADVRAMFADYGDLVYGALNQVVGLFAYCARTPGLVEAIRGRDWRTIAEKYNGSGAADTYAKLLKDEHLRLTAGAAAG